MAYAEENAYAVVLGKVIAHLRQKKGLTQGQLAEQVGVQQSTLSRIESGSLSPDAFVFKRLAMSFGYSAAELNGLVDRAYERTQATAISATNTSLRKDAPWWQVALGVAGIVGLAGLAIFAVAAVLDEEDT